MPIKEILCPNCHRTNSPDAGFLHDENQSLLCRHCNGVIFGTTSETDRLVKRPDQTYLKKEPLAIKKAAGEIPYEKGHRVKEVCFGCQGI